MKKLLAGLIAGLFMFGIAGMAQASLTHIGYAKYDNGTDDRGYKLIYDDDLQLTWLDYTHWMGRWQYQMDWAASLNNPGELEYYFSSGITQ